MQLWLLDHNYDLWKRVRWQMQDPALRPYRGDGVAFHGYLGTPDMMSRLHDAEPNLALLLDRGRPRLHRPEVHLRLELRWGSTFAGILSQSGTGAAALITWNLMLDEHGMPNIGPFSCGGLVTLRAGTNIEYSGQYWALRHFSQHVRRNAVRIASHSDASELSHVAFRNPDGSSVLVLTNSGEARDLRLVENGSQAHLKLPQNSVTTAVW